MMREKKRAVAALVNGIAGNGNRRAAASSAVEGQGLSSTKAAGPTFQVWSRDSHGFCTECEDTRATVLCRECDEAYCSLCWAALHRRGERAKHEAIPLGSEEELAPPPEALEESGWLAGVWPSQRPRTSPHPAIPASSSSSAGAGTEVGGVSSNNGGGDSAGAAAVNLARKNGNGAIVGNGAGPANGKSAEGWEGASANRNTEAVPVVSSGAPASATGARSMTGNGEPAAAKGGAVVVPGGQPKKVKLNGSALAAAAAPAAAPPEAIAPPQTPKIVPLTPPSTSTGVDIEVGAPPTAESSAHRSGSGSGSGSGSSSSGAAFRPEGHEGPLCPSGSFFSKPQTPPGSPTGGVSNRKNGAISTGGTKKKSQGEVGIHAKAGVDVAGGARGQGRHSQEGECSAAGGTGGGGSENCSTPAAGRAANGDAGLRAEESTENGHGENRNNGLSSSAAAKAGGEEAAAVVAEPAPTAGATGSDNMDVDAPLFSPAAMEAAAAGGGTDVEVPHASAPASEKPVGANGGGVSAGGAEPVGPAREATKSEKESLVDLYRRSTNIPLRLDPREREILGVLEGSLHHVQYTDEVDRIMRGGRLPYVLKNLGHFFTSVWGMYKASGVSLPTYSPPSGAEKRLQPRHLPPSVKPPYQNGGGRSGPAPVSSGKARAAGGGRNGSSSGGSGAYAWSAAGAGGGKAPAATAGGDGATGYREDSFVHKRTGWGYTLDWACVLRTCFEVGRRHKILNPEKMRSAHGMLMCIVMDTEHPLVREQTGFSCVRSMRTAFGLSVSANLVGLFEDPDLLAASRPVLPWERGQKLLKGGRNVEEMALQAKEKAEARRRLVARHGTGGLACEVTLLVDSVADSIVYREISTRPIRRMLSLLKNNWRPDRIDDARRNANLSIRSGDFGARLTHNHQTQFYFVMQSLMLWLEVTDNMLDLWAAGEKDMLEEDNQYRLSNTGQGLQRVQASLQGARRVGKRMNEYQVRVANTCGKPWVGSAVVHLGDSCVPNALTFLDKYSQVPWILNPILQALDYLTDLGEGSDPVVLEYIKGRWGTVEYAQRYILRNFFRFGFDGSGGDNNYDAGSCVDGRLTSAWNWCSKIEKKSFVNVFKLSGFSGFDGDFSR
ncbi:unnamed protein product [Ectocarpus sp. 13 AM-2016]